MPRFSGVPVAPTQQAQGPRFQGVPVSSDAPSQSVDPNGTGQVVNLIPTQTEGDTTLATYGFGGPAANSTKSLAPKERDFRDADQVRAALVQARINKDTGGAAFLQDQLDRLNAKANNPVNGMTNAQKFGAGAGKSVVDTGRGLSQLALQGANLATGGDLADKVSASKAHQDAVTARDQPLMDTAAGLAGNITGLAAMSAVPGSALRIVGEGASLTGLPAVGRGLMTAGNAIALPDSYAAAAGVGAAEGAAQPVGSTGGRLANTVGGALGGTLGRGIPQVLGWASGLTGRALPAVTKGAQETRAAKVLASIADDPAKLRQTLASPPTQIVPGSLPTTAEATGDIGLAGLQRSLANVGDFNNALTQRYMDNNAARTAFVQSEFGGANSAAADAIRSNRDRIAIPLLNTAKQATGVDVAKVAGLADSLIAARQGNPAVQDVVTRVKNQLDDANGDVAQLYNIRQYIDTLYKDGQDTAAKASRRELQTLKGALDNEIRKVSPEYGQYLNLYRGASRDADRVDVGQRLIDASSPIQDSMGNSVLSPAKVGNFARDPDSLVSQATGFKRATAQSVLTPQQQQAVQSLSGDLSRQASTASSGKAIGSNTAQNLAGMSSAQDAIGALGSMIPGGGISNVAMAGLNSVKKRYGEKVFAVVQDAMLNPERAAEVLQRLPDEQRRKLIREYGPALGIGASQPASEAFHQQ